MYINRKIFKCICGYVYMGRMQIVLSKETEEKLRKKAAEKFGFRKGSISAAIEEAVKLWLKAK